MSKLTDTLVKAGYVAANQGHGAISRMLWKGASMGDQARSQVLLDLSRLEADPDGSYQELAPRGPRRRHTGFRGPETDFPPHH